MAGLRSAVVDPEQERIDAQIAYANALRDMGSKGSTGAAAGGMHGQVYMVGNPWQGAINQIGGIALGAYGDHKARQLEALRRKEMSDWVGGMPGNTTTQPDFSEQQIRDIPSPMLTKQVPRLGTREVPKTWQQQAVDMQNWGKKGLMMDSPQAQQVAMEAIQSAVQTPEKMQQLEAQNELKKAILAAQYGYKGDLEQLKGSIRSNLQDQQGEIRMNQIGAQQGGANYRNDTNANVRTALTLAGFENAANRDANKAKAALTLKQTPSVADLSKAKGADAKLQKEQRANNLQIDQLDALANQIEARPKSFGWDKGIIGSLPKIGDKLLDEYDPEGIEARALFAQVSNMTLKDRSGSAVTDPEYIRFKQELGSVGSDPKALAIKIRNFMKVAKQKGWYIDNDIKQGGGTPVTAVSQTVRTPPAKPADMSDAEYAEFLSDKGYK